MYIAYVSMNCSQFVSLQLDNLWFLVQILIFWLEERQWNMAITFAIYLF